MELRNTRKTNEQIQHLATLLGLMVFAVAEALAQESQSSPAGRIVISIPDRKLALVESGRVIKVFPTAAGSPRTPSPAGSYRIVKRVNPTWYSKGKVVPPGKANPIGTRWIGLSARGYGIHGTNAPPSIGANVSHGCIRMRNRDVEELFSLVSVGDSVDLYNERTPE
ncbi:MAG TPA: L,D-transpeptidase [Bryobacteraceae bacterium]|nr:L,D-transpeptidase [Bryobacteraceae bacterium]